MISINIQSQPTCVTCGPTSLHALYNYYGDDITLDQVIEEISYVAGGGTLAVLLALHALNRGYTAKIYTYNIKIFDPTWFNVPTNQLSQHLIEKLERQREAKKDDAKIVNASAGYINYLQSGGIMHFEDLTPALLSKYFRRHIPILTGLSATYLYRSAREIAPDDFTTDYDDIHGYPSGHFVVLCGHHETSSDIVVADPYPENPEFKSHYYRVKINRLINSIMLGILTYDANFLIIEPPKKG